MFEHFGQDLILLERLAAGGMGEVYRAKQLGKAGFDKTVAVKMILPHYAARPEFKAMFEQEMRICARLQHPNVAQVFATGEWNGYLYLVMEFLDGRTVRDLIQRCQTTNTRIPPEHYSLICSEVARALSYAHGLRDETTGEPLKLVHRDISPQNIMLGYNGEVKILDFGVAKAADSLDLTKPGDLKGNLAYVSPEAIEALPLDGRADIFSLGTVAYELVTLIKLFGGESSFETINNVIGRKVPPISATRSDTPKEIEQIIVKALARNRDNRYLGADAMHRDLSKFLSNRYPDLVSNDLGQFISAQFEEDRKKVEKERKETNDLWIKTKENLKPVNPSLSGSFNVYTGAPADFMPDQTMVGQTGIAHTGINSIEVPPKLNLKLLIGLSVASVVLLVMSFVLLKPLMFGSDKDPIAWFQADDISEEGLVSSWPSSLNSSVLASQPEESRRPSLISFLDTDKKVLLFDGQDDFLSADQVAADLKTKKEFSVIMVTKPRVPQRQILWSLHLIDKDTDLMRTYLDKDNRVRIKWNRPASPGEIGSDPQLFTSMSIISTVVRPNAIEVFLNGSSLLSTDLITPLSYQAAAYFSIGQDYDRGVSTDFYSGEVGDVAVYPYALSPSERGQLEKKLAVKFGVDYKEN